MLNTFAPKNKYYFDKICSIVHEVLINHKILVIFLLFLFTPLIIFTTSIYALGKDALQFSTILTILLYLIYLNISFASRNYKIAIILVFILSFILKLFIATQFFGTFDMKMWYLVSETIGDDITKNFYEPYKGVIVFKDTELSWPYSPIWAFTNYFMNKLSQLIHISLSILIKIPIIIFNMLVAYLLYKIVRRNNKGKKEIFRVVASFLYNPIIIFVTAYGAQFGIIAIYFLLLYYYFSNSAKNSFTHLIYGFSIAVKQVTVFPLIFLLLRQKGIKKITFFAMTSFPFIVIILPYFIDAWKPVVHNTFLYSGIWAIWGYTRWIQHFTTLFGLYDLQTLLYLTVPKIMTIVLFGLMLYYFNKFKKISMLEGILISYLFFLILTPGFGTQYLVWILPFAVLFKNYYYYVYSVIGSLVAFFFYYGHGMGDNLFFREIIAYSLFGPILWLFCIYWLWRIHKEIKLRHAKA